MGHTLTNHHRVITRQLQPMQQQQAAARSVSPDAAAARRLHDWPAARVRCGLGRGRFSLESAAPMESPMAAATRATVPKRGPLRLGRPEGHGTRVDLRNPKVAAHRGKLPRSQSADSAQAEGCTRTRVSPEVEASSDGFARGHCHRGATVPKCDPRRLRLSGRVCHTY